MKNKALLIVALAAVAAIACTLLPASLTTSPASAAVNLIQNPGFEDPDTGVNSAPSSWTAASAIRRTRIRDRTLRISMALQAAISR